MSLDALRYMLDTNMLSDLARHPNGKVARQIRLRGTDSVCTSIIVAAELRFGAAKKAVPVLSQRIDAILDSVPVLAMEPEVDRQYAQTRLFLEQRGTPIGPNDLFIAAHALSLGLILVTANTGEFSRVPELQLDNWLTIP
jgi:tRNA(fMet)-specific endonuclease VapC